MLSLPEKIIFTLAGILSFYFTYVRVKRIIDQISTGQGKACDDGNRLARERMHNTRAGEHARFVAGQVGAVEIALP